MRRIELITESASCGITKEMSLEPLTGWRKSLRKIGLEVIGRTIVRGDAIGPAIESSRADIVAIAPHFSESALTLCRTLAPIHAKRNRPAIVLLDTFDQSSSPLLGVLPFVDRYAKKVLLRDRRSYLHPTGPSGFIFTDYLERELKYPLYGWTFGSVAPDEASLGKLVLGWGFGASSVWKRRAWAGCLLGKSWSHRRIDVNIRFAVPADADAGGWYARYRAQMRDTVNAALRGISTTSPERIGLREYRREQRDSRIVVSPFGYGELCLRDLEAIFAGALLVKPSVDHLEASPNVYEAGVTYRPVAWDGSDIGAVVRDSLAQPQECIKMIRAGRQKMWDYLFERGWLKDVERVFEGLGRN